MEPGFAGFMDDIEDDALEEDCEDLLDFEIDEIIALGGVIGAALEEEERFAAAAEMDDQTVDAAIDEIAAQEDGRYCRLKGIWKDNPKLARHVYRKIYGKS